MKLPREQFKALEEALLDAFRDEVALRKMVRMEMDENVGRIVEKGSLGEMVFNLINEWAEPEDRVDDLIAAGRRANERNQLLKNVEALIVTSHSSKPAPLPRAPLGQSDAVSVIEPSLAPSHTAPAPLEESKLSISNQADSDPETITPEEESHILFEGPCYALIIGINYRPAKPGAQRFPTLEYAEKDARDFARFLESSGFPKENIHMRLGPQALRDKITDEFEWLGTKCRVSGNRNPLVVVYFSGHGWTDKGKHYLIPYDANPDKLFSSAFSNIRFDECLSLQETQRLVVFVDACHAGAIGTQVSAEQAAQKGPPVPYDAYSDLASSQGRFLIASCGPGQKSYEWEKKQNSIFTYHLLDLLRCKGDDLDQEEIDAFDLFVKLQEKVSDTATRLNFDKQVPYTRNNERGIILAINKRVREAKLTFLKLVIVQLMAQNSALMPWIVRELKNYVKQKDPDRPFDPAPKESAYGSFYRVFDAGFQQWNSSHADSLVVQCRDYLIDEYKDANDSASKRSPSQSAVQPDIKLIETQESKIRGTGKPPTATALVTPSTDQQGQRLFSDEDCECILDPIMQTFDYKDERKKLNASLRRPVSEKEFARTLNSISVKTEDEKLKNILGEIEARFVERWPKAKEPQTVSSVLIKRSRT